MEVKVTNTQDTQFKQYQINSVDDIRSMLADIAFTFMPGDLMIESDGILYCEIDEFGQYFKLYFGAESFESFETQSQYDVIQHLCVNMLGHNMCTITEHRFVTQSESDEPTCIHYCMGDQIYFSNVDRDMLTTAVENWLKTGKKLDSNETEYQYEVRYVYAE